MADAPVVDIDMFGVEAIRNARAVDDGLRELAPAVKLSREDITIIGRHEHVKDGLADWRTFSSASRPWHDPDSPRPEILLTDDPPRHTDVRAVVARAMSKRALDRWEARFRSDATRIVDTLIERSGQVVDATADISRPFVYKALPDVIGLPEQGREHMEAFGHMVWSTLGPPNELFEEAMADLETLGGWIGSATLRENLAPDSLGMAIYDAADAGKITDDDALLLVQTIVAASADTTVMTLSAAIRAFCEFPDQWQVLRAEPGLVRNAFDESLRWDSPSRMAGRITTTRRAARRHHDPRRRAMRVAVRRGQSRSAQMGRARPVRCAARPGRATGLGLRCAPVRRASTGAARGRRAAVGADPAGRSVGVCR